jgi:transcriptional regulator with XRE-family HTH domain
VLCDWRRKRGLSQLDLALASAVSQRHISFLESGRAQPSRDMVLRLAMVLDIPLRAQNMLMIAAGFAPIYQERDLTDPEMRQVRKALDCLLRQQEPYPAMVIDRRWNLLVGNEAATQLLAWLRDPASMPAHMRADGRLNLLRALCHPDGLRPYIQNWPTVAGWLIERIHREAVADGQSDTTMALLREVLAYPEVPRAWQIPNWEAPHEPLLTVVLAKDDRVLQFLTTITTFGTPHDITLQELRVECFFPADEATERLLQTWIHHGARPASPEPPKGAAAESARRARMTPRKQPSRM